MGLAGSATEAKQKIEILQILWAPNHQQLQWNRSVHVGDPVCSNQPGDFIRKFFSWQRNEIYVVDFQWGWHCNEQHICWATTCWISRADCRLRKTDLTWYIYRSIYDAIVLISKKRGFVLAVQQQGSTNHFNMAAGPIVGAFSLILR